MGGRSSLYGQGIAVGFHGSHSIAIIQLLCHILKHADQLSQIKVVVDCYLVRLMHGVKVSR